jgi:hypothetical protein
MFTTVGKSLGFIAPVIPSGKHLQQKDPIRACWRRYVCRKPCGSVFSTKGQRSPSRTDKVPQRLRTFGTIQDMVVKN